MSGSNLVERLRLAREALLLVSQGKSERSAVSRIASAAPSFQREKSLALKLVIDTVSRLDSLNGAVETIFSGEKFDKRSLALFHLTAYIMLADHTDARTDLIRALRRISSEREGPRLEQLLGSLVASAPSNTSSDMNEIDQVGIQTHNPPWWVSYCFYHFGRETSLKILSPPARHRYLRVNPLGNRGRTSLPRESRKSSAQLAETDSGTYLLSGSPSTLANYFETGRFQAQAVASYLAVKAAGPAPGTSDLGRCSCPRCDTA